MDRVSLTPKDTCTAHFAQFIKLTFEVREIPREIPMAKKKIVRSVKSTKDSQSHCKTMALVSVPDGS